jgi:pimeloyl-ACP methyl ester carboxylesterase
VAFVLVHGGGCSGRYWDRLLPFLDEPALAIDLPGRAGKPFDPMTFTIEEGVASAVADVDAAQLGDDLVLVAHSSGGLFAPEIAAGLAPRVRHIVLSAASVPPDGGTGLDSMKDSHRRRVVESMDAARRDGWTLMTPGPTEPEDKVRRAYGGDDLDDDLVAFMTDPVRCVKDSMNFYFQPVSWSSVRDVPITYVKHLRDRPSPPEFQDELIERLRACGCDVTVVEIDSGHIPAVTHPEAFGAILERVTEEASSP